MNDRLEILQKIGMTKEEAITLCKVCRKQSAITGVQIDPVIIGLSLWNTEIGDFIMRMNDVDQQEQNWRIRVTAWDVVGIVSSVGLVVSVTLLVLWFFEMGK